MAGYYLSERDKSLFDEMSAAWPRLREMLGGGGGLHHAHHGFDSENLKVKITSVISGQGGRYKGKIIREGVEDEASGNLAAADFGTVDDDEGALIWNLAEINTSAHSIEVGGTEVVRIGIIIGWDKATKFPIVAIGGGGGDNGFWLRVSGYAAISGNTGRFTYSGKKQKIQASGLFADSDTDTTTYTVYNTVESYNDGAGVEGNSADLAKYPTGSNIKPIQGNPVVWCRRFVDCYGNPIYFITYENGMPELCDAS